MSQKLQLNPYLAFNGQCEEAFKFYEKALGGKIVAMIPHEGSPAEGQVPPEWRKKIMHARLEIGDHVLMGGDAPPQHQVKPQGFTVALQIPDVADAERVFKALSESGNIQMPFQETFWAIRFGMLTDRYGVPWMVNCEKAGAVATSQ